MDVYFRKFDPDAMLPILGSVYSAGYDFYALNDYTIPAYGRGAVSTGIGVAWSDPNAYLQLMSRSGLFSKEGISCEAGVIDYDYLQPISVLLQNHTPNEYTVRKGDRVCQGIFLQKSCVIHHSVTDEWHKAGESYFPFCLGSRNGGFGSTGK